MKRREFVTALGVGAAGAVLAGCNSGSESGSEQKKAVEKKAAQLVVRRK